MTPTVVRSPLATAFIPGYPGHTSGPQTSVTRIVIHATVSSCVPGGARSVAGYFQSPAAGGLAHYVVDPNEIVQCAAENVVTWHAPPNGGSIGIELCDPQAGDPGRWADALHASMLGRAAALVRDIAGRWGVPLAQVDATGLLGGARGICGHDDVSAAWHESTHTDPQSAFPWAQFMASLKPAPTPTPSPAPVLEDDMAYLLYEDAAGRPHTGVIGPLVFTDLDPATEKALLASPSTVKIPGLAPAAVIKALALLGAKE